MRDLLLAAVTGLIAAAVIISVFAAHVVCLHLVESGALP